MSSAFRVSPLEEPRSYALWGELDLSTAEHLWEALADDCESAGEITLDLSELTFLDSSGLHILLNACKALGMNGDLILRSPSPQVDRVLEVSGIEGVDGLRIER